MGPRLALLFLAVLCNLHVSWALGNYGEACDGGSCVGDTLQCDGTNCVCADTYTDNTGSTACILKVLGDTCTADAECAAIPAVCRGATNAKTCKTAVDLGITCDADEACADANAVAICAANTGTACTCKTGYVKVDTACKVAYGADCDGTDNTCTPTSQQCSTTCICETAYTENTAANGCVLKATAVGDDCEADDNICVGVPNSACVVDGGKKCNCKTGYAANTAGTVNTACLLKATTLGGACTEAANCGDLAESECTSDKCVCKAEYSNDGNGVCKSIQGCDTTTTQCDTIANTACETDRCVCKSGYQKETTVGTTYDSCVTIPTENGSGQLLFSGGLLLLTTFVMMM